MGLTDPAYLRGIAMLEHILAALTPKATALLPNYPNPFTPETWIPYHLANDTDMQIWIYDNQRCVGTSIGLGASAGGLLHGWEPCCVLGGSQCRWRTRHQRYLLLPTACGQYVVPAEDANLKVVSYRKLYED